MPSLACPIQELHAQPSWQAIDFISDLHLHADEPGTFRLLENYLSNTAADAVFVLGDLFEVWVGDDCVHPTFLTIPRSFEDHCARSLHQAGQKLALFFMPGNRDFLVGQTLMQLCNAHLLDDPTVLVFKRQRWLLSHGDALCINDTNYMQFRRQVRSPQWQRVFLAQPLHQRRAIALEMRRKSQAQQNQHQQSPSQDLDVDAQAARQWLQAANVYTLIHGHTHQPATHGLGEGLSRVVLSDWDTDASPARAQVLRLRHGVLQRFSLC